MKYAKKMKLVDIDDAIPSSTVHLHQKIPTDDEFSASRTLSILDSSMNEIMNRQDIDDGEKWILYNQILQRYLNHLKKIQTSNTTTERIQSGQDQRIDTPSPFQDRLVEHDISGIFPIRDSLETISQPNVRNFFVQARRKDIQRAESATPSRKSSLQYDISPLAQQLLNRSLPTDETHLLSPSATRSQSSSVETRKTPSQEMDWNDHLASKNVQKRRGRKRGAQLNMTNVHPYKIVPRSLYRPRHQPPNRYDFIWENTQAK